ncbi:MAG: SPFH domain-containing protein [Candidatus Azambacteria bacterium]|nr:SPFH domain-containing protein [Candidatus Azambacteria bacterium]
MTENKGKDDDLFGLLVPAIFVMFMVIGGSLFFFEDGWLPASAALIGGLFWAILAFRTVKPAFAGLMFRFGSRVMVGDNYLVKKEGWTFIFPILERIVEISLRQHKEEINAKKIDETEDVYLNRAESFSTAEGINIFPEIFFSYKIVNPGKVFELGGGIDANGDSPFLSEMFHDLVMGGTRGVLAKMELTAILSRTTEENGIAIPIGEKIRNEIICIPNFERLGAELLILRIEDIKFKKDAQDVLDALENVKKQRLAKESETIEAEKRLAIQEFNSKTLINKSEAELTESRNKALAKNAEIAAFVGKKQDQPTTAEDGKAYAQFQIGLEVAKSFATGTKVIIPAGDVSKVMAGLVNVFEASKSN